MDKSPVPGSYSLQAKSSDSLAAIIADLRDRVGHYDYCNCDSCSERKEWADRLERIDAEMREADRIRQAASDSEWSYIAELRERLAAYEAPTKDIK